MDEYVTLAARLARSGVCAEVNTSGLRKPVGEIYPEPELLGALHRAGVPVTLGSDAHAPNEVAADYGAACALLRATGYTSYVGFDRRKRTPLDLR